MDCITYWKKSERENKGARVPSIFFSFVYKAIKLHDRFLHFSLLTLSKMNFQRATKEICLKLAEYEKRERTGERQLNSSMNSWDAYRRGLHDSVIFFLSYVTARKLPLLSLMHLGTAFSCYYLSLLADHNSTNCTDSMKK